MTRGNGLGLLVALGVIAAMVGAINAFVGFASAWVSIALAAGLLLAVGIATASAAVEAHLDWSSPEWEEELDRAPRRHPSEAERFPLPPAPSRPAPPPRSTASPPARLVAGYRRNRRRDRRWSDSDRQWRHRAGGKGLLRLRTLPLVRHGPSMIGAAPERSPAGPTVSSSAHVD
jgi:hypothetical protein